MADHLLLFVTFVTYTYSNCIEPALQLIKSNCKKLLNLYKTTISTESYESDANGYSCVDQLTPPVPHCTVPPQLCF